MQREASGRQAAGSCCIPVRAASTDDMLVEPVGQRAVQRVARVRSHAGSADSAAKSGHRRARHRSSHFAGQLEAAVVGGARVAVRTSASAVLQATGSGWSRLRRHSATSAASWLRASSLVQRRHRQRSRRAPPGSRSPAGRQRRAASWRSQAPISLSPRGSPFLVQHASTTSASAMPSAPSPVRSLSIQSSRRMPSKSQADRQLGRVSREARAQRQPCAAHRHQCRRPAAPATLADQADRQHAFARQPLARVRPARRALRPALPARCRRPAGCLRGSSAPARRARTAPRPRPAGRRRRTTRPAGAGRSSAPAGAGSRPVRAASGGSPAPARTAAASCAAGATPAPCAARHSPA